MPLHAQPSPDAEPSVNLRVYPLDVWNPRAGWGLGAGLVVHDLVRPGSQVLLTVAPAVHEQVATLSLASARPSVADAYVVLDARAETTERQWFYGLGPRSADDTKVALDMNRWWIRLRPGRRLGSTPVHVQPHLTLMQHDVNGVKNEDERAFSHLSPASARSIPGTSPTPELGPRQLGVRAGLDVIVDTRDRTAGTTRGLLAQATAATYEEVLEQDLRYDRLNLRAHGVLPLGGRHRLALGLRTAVTNDRGRAPVPFYLLPQLDGQTAPGWRRHRFFGSDLVASHLLYGFPLGRFRDVLRVDGHVGIHAASVYDNLGRQFALDVSFDETLSGGSTVPLRPSASAGIRLGPLFRDETYLSLALGLSPEGVTGVRFTIVPSLRTLRPPHHDRP